MLDNPDAYTEQEIQDIIDRDEDTRETYRLMVEAKRSVRHRQHQKPVDVDAAWQRFVAAHPTVQRKFQFRKIAASLTFGRAYSRSGEPMRASLSSRIAASFIGVLLASGIAFAAIQIVRNISTSQPQLPTAEQTTGIEPPTSLSADTVKADTISAEPYIFNNVPLDSMLTAIATAHGVGVEFKNDTARGLRFHFVWKREDSLSRVVEKLNTFEAVNIGMEDKTLVVR